MGSLGVRLALVAAVATGCGTDTAAASSEAPAYRDVVELFDQGIARTCSLNGGVCHNSNNYPDLHTVTNLLATLDRPCNVETSDRRLLNDACEPAADHLVIASAGIDVRIVSAALAADELNAPVRDLTKVSLVVDPAPLGLAAGATDTTVRRSDGTIFAIGEYDAKVASVSGSTIVLDLRSSYGNDAAKQFFDVRVYPPGPLRIHVGDPNANGTEGALRTPMPLIAPGDPENSYLLRRLTDKSFGELMPRQCRTWDDRANQALACWITGLSPDASNAYEPIDYRACKLDVRDLGKCITIADAGFTAVEKILARSCAGTGCHVNETEPAAGLDLSAGKAYAALVGMASTVVGDRIRVEPGDPDASYLMCKVGAACDGRVGSRMPLGAAVLSDAELEIVRTWITDGAPP